MTSPPRVLLLHGLWMPGASMAWMAAALVRAGFETRSFTYGGARLGPVRVLPALSEALEAGVDHVVAHSLGGLMTLAALERMPDAAIRRVVCLGSPLCGSGAARGLERRLPTRLMLGRAAPLLSRGCRPWTGRAEVGVIAGSRPVGLGHVFGGFDGPHDGSVAVAETRLDGIADHRVLPVSHTGMLASRQVAAATIAFLRHGRFAADFGAEQA